ncbi:SusC/RagA family TonB-linked outer membrane protein [Thermoflexibacter ruber]|uniref:TonB-linked outer membrane protein, SusC/RagA family n=1 Tax=Thermoflexibacter ruber TaxID=1003 RepID=A0A1I2CGM8_9BACT|nr:SusC/RagA family TonB-linked outer membrane protein [Thermoflexibacter ruber]SFE67507.1 TonB-linked outer membrane protein, SusC/RagA family [Thermoflexibacter ruber]
MKTKLLYKTNWRFYYFITAFALLLQTSLQAQTLARRQDDLSLRYQVGDLKKENVQSLKNVLKNLESKYNVRFVYAGTVKADKLTVTTIPQSDKIEQVLENLLVPLGLRYQQMESQLFIITPEKPKENIKEIPNTASSVFTPLEISTLPLLNAGIKRELLRIEKRITGTVTSAEDNSPIPGVNIVAKGTNVGTITDSEGKYSLSVPDNTTTLVFSYVGFATQEVEIGNRTTIDVKMALDVKTLQDIVVIGYGERDKKDLTGAVSVVGAEDIAKSVAMQPELSMQGRMAGVFVSTPGGNPNARPQVRIRGVSTFGYAEPLYVVDGIPLTEFGDGVSGGLIGDIRGNVNVLNLINPNDIESISVLKDASAAAIYGVRASNGVILITTKRGKSGRPKVEFNASRGVQNIPKKFDMLDVNQYTRLYQEAYANNPDEAKNLPPEFNPQSPAFLGNRPTVDWQTPLIQRNAITEDYSAKVYGGNDATTYYVSAGYGRTQSTLVQNDMERYSFATNVKSNISKIFEVGATYRLGYINALDNTRTDLGYVSRTSPWQQIFDPTHPTGFAPSISARFRPNPELGQNTQRPLFLLPIPAQVFDGDPTLLWGVETNNNVFAQQALNDTRYNMLRNMGTAYLQMEPVKGLKFRGTFSADWYYNKRNDWNDFNNYLFSQTPGNPYSGNDGTSKGGYGERHTRNTNFVKEFSVSYNKSFGDHSFDVILNAMDQEYKYDFLQASSGQIPFSDPLFRNINNLPPFSNAGSFRNINRLQGYMGRVSYKYADKYYADVTVRRDGSSRFAPGYKWGTFPSFALAWRISREDFMKDLTFINDLKLRGGWGQLGNQETASFAFLSSVSTTPDYATGSGAGNAVGNLRFGVRLPDFPVVDLSWEVASTTNVGFDGVFLNNKITATVEYYSRLTSGILQGSQLPASVGNENQPILNIASVRNSGVELQLGYNGKIGEDFTFNIGGNLTTVRNRTISVFRDQPFGGEGGRIEVGYPLFFLWGYKVGGIFQSQEEINAWTATKRDANNGNNFKPGDMYFEDVRSAPTEPGKTYSDEPDNVVNAFDRTYIGKTIAGYFYGINLSANWKNFDLSIFFQGIGDVQKINGERWGGESMSSTGVNQWTTVLNRWTPQNPSTTMPRAVRNDPAGNNRFSSRWVENAGFMRLKNFQLGYSLPRSLMSKTGVIDRCRVFISGTNVFTFTRWTGPDPENDILPPARTFMLGLSATF